MAIFPFLKKYTVMCSNLSRCYFRFSTVRSLITRMVFSLSLTSKTLSIFCPNSPLFVDLASSFSERKAWYAKYKTYMRDFKTSTKHSAIDLGIQCCGYTCSWADSFDENESAGIVSKYVDNNNNNKNH